MVSDQYRGGRHLQNAREEDEVLQAARCVLEVSRSVSASHKRLSSEQDGGQ